MKGSQYETVYNKLLEGIVDGRYRPGERLTERVISEELNVSRTPVREALRKLELEKLVINKPYHGVVVNELTVDDAREIYEVHANLEGLSLRLATRNIDEEVLSKLEINIREAEKEMHSGDIQQMIKRNREFHSLILKCSKNSYLIDMIERLQVKISLLRVTTLSVPERAKQNIEEHKLIFQALSNRDEKLAEYLGQFHIRNASKYALKLLGEKDRK